MGGRRLPCRLKPRPGLSTWRGHKTLTRSWVPGGSRQVTIAVFIALHLEQAAVIGLALALKLLGVDKLAAARLLSPALGGVAGAFTGPSRLGARFGAAAISGWVGIIVVYAVAPVGMVATGVLGGASAGGTAGLALAVVQQPES